MYQQPELAADKEAREKRERGEEDEVDENGNPKPKEYEGIPDIPENRKVIDYLKSRPKTGVHVALAPEIITSKCFRCGHYGHRTGDRDCAFSVRFFFLSHAGPMFMQGNPKNEEFNHRHLDPMASYLSKKKQKAPASSTDISVVSKSSSGLSALDYRSILDESSNSSSSSSSESSSEERKRRKRKRRRRKEKRDRSRRSHSRKKSRSRRSRSRSHSRSRSPSPRSSHHRHRPGLLEDEGDREGRGREGNSSRRRSSPPSRKRSRSRSTERSHRKRTEGGDYKRRRRR